MVRKLLLVILLLAFVVFVYQAYQRFSTSDEESFACISDSSVTHGVFRSEARYSISMKNGSGSMRVNGSATEDNINFYPISRQIYFTYKKTDNEFTLKNTQITVFSNDRSSEGGIPKHYPPFFLAAGNSLAFEILDDKYSNKIFIVGDVPVLYCVTEHR